MEEMLKLAGDEFDGAIIGVASVWQGNQRVETMIYSGERIVEILMEQGHTDEQSREYVSFNIEGAYVGPATPIIVWDYDE